MLPRGRPGLDTTLPMYQFAKWKYWLVIIVMVVGTLFALPNVFGEGPALQLSRNDRTAMDQANIDKVLGLLQADTVPVEASHTRKDRLVLRFSDAETQAKARETITKRGKGEYLVALSDRLARAGLDARDRPEADEPRPRPARRRALRL